MYSNVVETHVVSTMRIFCQVWMHYDGGLSSVNGIKKVIEQSEINGILMEVWLGGLAK